jgi:hypothetical protein
MKLPYSWNATGIIPMQITECGDDGFDGTQVRGTVYGVSFMPFVIKGIVVGDKPGQAGFDDVRARIEGIVIQQICEAMAVYTRAKNED